MNYRILFLSLTLSACYVAGAQTRTVSVDSFAALENTLRAGVGSSRDTLLINVKPGVYTMNHLLDIRGENSRPIIVRAEEGRAVFSGGFVVRGWEKVSEGLYRTFVPENFNGLEFKQFYVNGRRATLCRTPNEGTFYLPVSISESSFPGKGYSVVRVQCGEEVIKTISGNPKVRFYHKWDNTYGSVKAVDEEAFYMASTQIRHYNTLDSSSRFFLYDYPQALDSPGEWYMDRSEGYLYYRPLQGEDISTAECVIPVLKHWVKIQGTPHKHISNICFENISFAYSSYVIPEGIRAPEQGAVTAPSAIQLDFADNISFVNCEMCHTGAYAVCIGEQCFGNAIQHCFISDLGAGGVRIGITRAPSAGQNHTRGNVVDDNIITSGGYELPCGVGIAILNASDNVLSHNEISNLRYSGISVGWVWGYSASVAVNNVIEYNHIHHLGWGELSDMGAVYTLGVSDGTRVNNNWIHDVVSYGYGGWGLYTDEGSTHIKLYNNLVYRCKCALFHQHYGKENFIGNNIFAYGRLFQLQITKVEDHTSFTFDGNIILQNCGTVSKGRWNEAKINFGRNIYWSEGGNFKFCDDALDFVSWKKEYDHSALNVDPMFVDARNDDYRFKSLKNARKIGFVPFDWTQAGVYGSGQWKQKALLSSEITDDFDKASAPRLDKL